MFKNLFKKQNKETDENFIHDAWKKEYDKAVKTYNDALLKYNCIEPEFEEYAYNQVLIAKKNMDNIFHLMKAQREDRKYAENSNKIT